MTGSTCFQGPRAVPVRLDGEWLCPGAVAYQRFDSLQVRSIATVEVRRDRPTIAQAPCPGWYDGVILIRLKVRRGAT